MRIAVIDGQGGGVGRSIIDRVRTQFGGSVSILALGTNAVATNLMLKAGADEGASGENAIIVNAPKVDAIVGCVAILSADSMLGEITSSMAAAIGSSPAMKILIPLNRCGIEVVGLRGASLSDCIEDAIETLKRFSFPSRPA
jgi:hypothetical protein